MRVNSVGPLIVKLALSLMPFDVHHESPFHRTSIGENGQRIELNDAMLARIACLRDEFAGITHVDPHSVSFFPRGFLYQDPLSQRAEGKFRTDALLQVAGDVAALARVRQVFFHQRI